jgi:uncharacterized membrane protein YeaQ/YmgE (transglycosylase-associated protein family)
MSPELRDFLLLLRALVITLAIGAAVAAVFFYIKRKDLFGGYIGGFVVGFLGALLGVLIIDKVFYDMAAMILEFLSRGAGVNIIAGFLGAWAALYIMNRLNHDKERTKY